MTTSVFTKSAEGDTEGCGWVRDYFKLDELVKSMIQGKITKYVHVNPSEKRAKSGIFKGKTIPGSGRMSYSERLYGLSGI